VLRALEIQNHTWVQFIARGVVEVDEMMEMNQKRR
jgi:hypothetical protein